MRARYLAPLLLSLAVFGASAEPVTVTGSTTTGIGNDGTQGPANAANDTFVFQNGAFDTTDTNPVLISNTMFTAGTNCSFEHFTANGCAASGSVPLSLTIGGFTNTIGLSYSYVAGMVADTISFAGSSSDLFFGTQEFLFTTNEMAFTDDGTGTRGALFGTLNAVAPTSVPEPGILALGLIGLGAFGLSRRKTK